MAYNFKNLADVELLNTMPEEANVLVEVDGATKRAPMKNNASEEKILIIKDPDFDSMISGIAVADCMEEIIYTANMTFEEALDAFMKCKLNQAYVYQTSLAYTGSDLNFERMAACTITYAPTIYVSPCLEFSFLNFTLYWTVEKGISNYTPESAYGTE